VKISYEKLYVEKFCQVYVLRKVMIFYEKNLSSLKKNTTQKKGQYFIVIRNLKQRRTCQTHLVCKIFLPKHLQLRKTAGSPK
jgi:hypothetical protein